MTTNLLLSEREKYERVWRLPEYGKACHGLKLWRTHRRYFPQSADRALDIGCGSGALFAHWNESRIDGWGVDLVRIALRRKVEQRWGHKFRCSPIWDMSWPARFPVGVCADVLEHLPPEMVRSSLQRMAAACDLVVSKIAHVPAHPWLGEESPLHLTVQRRDWWIVAMESVAGKVDALPSVTRSGFTDSVLRWRIL